MQDSSAASNSDPPPAHYGDDVHAEVVAHMRADRLIYAQELGRWLSAIGTRAWPTRRATRLLRRNPEVGFQIGRRGPWVTTWGQFFAAYPRLAARILSHVSGSEECVVCGRGPGDDELDDM